MSKQNVTKLVSKDLSFELLSPSFDSLDTAPPKTALLLSLTSARGTHKGQVTALMEDYRFSVHDKILAYSDSLKHHLFA